MAGSPSFDGWQSKSSGEPGSPAPPPQPVRVEAGLILNETFQVFFANAIPFMVMTALALSPMIIVTTLLFVMEPKMLALWDGLRQLMAVFLAPIATGAVTFGVYQHLRSERATVADCMKVGVSRLIPIILVSIVGGLATFAGMLACIIPGIIVACAIFVAVPAAVVERPGIIGALERSWELTRERRLQIFAVMFAIGAINGALAMFVGFGVLGAQVVGSNLLLMVSHFAQVGVSILTTSLAATAGGLTYYYLRRDKESLDLEELASVFD